MTIIRVVLTSTIDIDINAYVAAGIAAEWLVEDELDNTDHLAVAEFATGYADPTENLPRWARDSVTVTGHNIHVSGILEESTP